MNEIVEQKNWWKRNWKWLAFLIGLFSAIIYMITTSEIGEVASETFKAYTDPDLTEKALILAQENDEVKELLGVLNPIDKFAIFEGRVKYLKDNSAVDISVRVKGSNGRGRMRIFADRNGDKWEYKEIVIGIKKLKKTITIVERKE